MATPPQKRDTSFMAQIPVRELFLARCQDARVTPNAERERRFAQCLARNCTEFVLDLREQGLKRHAVEVLAAWLATASPSSDANEANDGFVVVVLSNNELGDEGAAALCLAVLRNATVTHLDVRSNNIAANGARALFEALEANRTLTSIDVGSALGVHRNVLSVRGAKALATALTRNHVLSCINARDVGLGIRGAESLAAGLRVTDSLARLDLSRNQLGPEGCASVCHALAAAASAPLEYLNLSSNAVGNPGAEAIAELLAVHATLEAVDISSNAIGPTGMTAIGRALQLRQQHSPLIAFNAADNSSGNAGVVELARWAARSPVLSALLLAGNAISSGEELAAVIRGSVTLERLDLRHNVLGSSGVSALCDALISGGSSERSVLSSLDLGGNRIDGSAGKVIARAVAENTTLQHLSLRDNRLDAAACSAIASAIVHNDTLLTLNVDVGNNVSYADHAAIDQQLRKNRRAWERDAPLRDAEQLARLREKVQQLHEIEQELAETTAASTSIAACTEAVQQALAEAEATKEHDVTAVSAELSTKTATVRDIAEAAGAAETAALRDAKESKRQQLIGQIKEQRGVARKLTMMVERLSEELHTRLTEFESEREELTKQLNIAAFDLQSSSEDVSMLRQKAADMRSVLSRLEEHALVVATDSAARKKKGGAAKQKSTSTTSITAPTTATAPLFIQEARDRLTSARMRILEDTELPTTQDDDSSMLPRVRSERSYSDLRPLTTASVMLERGLISRESRAMSRDMSLCATMLLPPEAQVRLPSRPARLAPLKPPPLPSEFGDDDFPGTPSTSVTSSLVSGRLRSASFAQSTTTSRLPKTPLV